MKRTPHFLPGSGSFTMAMAWALAAVHAQAVSVRWIITEQGGNEPLPCRIHLQDETGQAVRAPGLPFWRDHFVCPGEATLDLPPGRYRWEVERGPEYDREFGELQLEEGKAVEHRVALRRLANLAGEGWWSGETHVHRPVSDLALLMRAEDLHVAQAITWWNDMNLWRERDLPADPLLVLDGNRFVQILAGEDERGGGALLYFNLTEPLPIAGARREHPAAVTFLEQARSRHGRRLWVDVEKPFWWDMPIWVASGLVDSVGLAHNHMHRSGVLDNEAWGRPRPADAYPSPQGNGFWSQDIYYHLLNAGLRLPPTAGSASGVLPNPVGYNRMYVQTGSVLTYEGWWEGVRAGRVFVSNGPLLRVQGNGAWPGEVFVLEPGRPLSVQIEARLTSRDPVERVEVIRNGRVIHRVEGEAWGEGASLPALRFEESGWFLVRVLAKVPGTFRFASSGPFYVESREHPRRVSRESARFFLDWVRERGSRLDLPPGPQREEVLRSLERAERFWMEKLDSANAE